MGESFSWTRFLGKNKLGVVLFSHFVLGQYFFWVRNIFSLGEKIFSPLRIFLSISVNFLNKVKFFMVDLFLTYKPNGISIDTGLKMIEK